MRVSIRTAAAAAAVLLAAQRAVALENGAALTPPRGFRSWNLFGLAVNQGLMESVMDAMVNRSRTVAGAPTSLADLGYTDVGLDDGWQKCHAGVNGGFHDASGKPIVNTDLFPNLTAMVAHAHALNLTAGFYGNNCYCADSGHTVAGFIGDVGLVVDAGFDSYKVDSCGGQQDVALYSNLLSQTSPSKPIVLENCHNGAWYPQPIRKPGGTPWCPFNMYRSSLDISVDYQVIFGINMPSVLPFADGNLSYPGCWAYPDMLEVGVCAKGKCLTPAEARSHFGAWCILSSPLILGLDPRNDSVMDAVWPIISNTEALEVNSAWAGSSGTRLLRSNTSLSWGPCGFWANCTAPSWEVLWKPLPGGDVALLFLNHDVTSAQNITVPWAAIPGLSCPPATGCAVRDIWAHASLGTFATGYTLPSLASHDSAFLRVSPTGQ